MKRIFARTRRKGVATVQWCLIAGSIALVVIATVSFLGDATNSELNKTAVGVGDPTQLPGQFGPPSQ